MRTVLSDTRRSTLRMPGAPLVAALLCAATWGVSWGVSCAGPREAASAGPDAVHAGQLAHSVYFDLTDDSAAESFIADCKRLLPPIPGVVRVLVGRRGAAFDRAVNNTAFDVVLTVVFEDRAAHDGYQVHPRHRELVTAWAPRLAGFEVFDAWIE